MENFDNEPKVVESEIVQVESVTVSQNETDETSSFLVSFNQIQQQIEEIGKETKNVSNDLKNLKKKYLKLVKALTKTKKRKSNDPLDETAVKKEPSGFISPIELSQELTEFLDLPSDIKLPRTVVTKKIITYIKENGLESTTNGRNFDLTDSTNEKAMKLRRLFNVPKGDEVTYFNLQSFLKPHFITSSMKSVPNEDSTMLEVVPDVSESKLDDEPVDSAVLSEQVPKKKIKVRRQNKAANV